MNHFADHLLQQIRLKKTPLMVGLDPRFGQLPQALRGDNPDVASVDSQQQADAYRLFCTEIIDVVAPLVAVVKPQMAFFEALGPAGLTALSQVIDHAVNRGLLVVLDGKRNDIGTTAEAYASAYLGRKPLSPWGADALTVNPWMGFDTLAPFYEIAQKRHAGLFVLVHTSNPGSVDLQEQPSPQGILYQQVAAKVEQLSASSLGQEGFGIAGAVVGATFPEQLTALRQQMPQTLFLVPGFGAQGGAAADVAGAFREDGLGAVINSSRGIIFAYQQPEFETPDPRYWQRAIEQATLHAIDALASETPAGRLR